MESITLINANEKILKQLYKKDITDIGLQLRPYKDGTKMKAYICYGIHDDIPSNFEDEPIADIPSEYIETLKDKDIIKAVIERSVDNEMGNLIYEIVANIEPEPIYFESDINDYIDTETSNVSNLPYSYKKYVLILFIIIISIIVICSIIMQ